MKFNPSEIVSTVQAYERMEGKNKPLWGPWSPDLTDPVERKAQLRMLAVLVHVTRLPGQADTAALVRALHERGQKPLVVALRTPYDLMAFPMIEDYVCCYSVRPVAIEAVARLLCGEIEAQGRLPCRIPGLT